MSPAYVLSTRDLGLLVILTLSWSLNWTVLKVGVTGFPPMTFRLLCMIASVPLVGGLARARGVELRVPRGDLVELLVLVITNMVLWIVLTAYGVMLLSSGRAAILAYTMPIWAALLGIVLYGEHPSRRLWIGVGFAALGVLLLLVDALTTMAGRPLGTLLMLAAALVWAYGTHRMRRSRTRMHVFAITFWSLVAALVVSAAMAWAFERAAWTAPPRAAVWWAVLFNATVIFGVAQPIWFRLATILPPVVSGLSIMLTPVLGVLFGIVLLGERAAWTDWTALGAVVVAMGSVLLPTRSRSHATGSKQA